MTFVLTVLLILLFKNSVYLILVFRQSYCVCVCVCVWVSEWVKPHTTTTTHNIHICIHNVDIEAKFMKCYHYNLVIIISSSN